MPEASKPDFRGQQNIIFKECPVSPDQSASDPRR
jgi:hypothetical protein